MFDQLYLWAEPEECAASDASFRQNEAACGPITAEWLAGFVDGEGSLGIAGHGGMLQPRFRLNQRDDDGDLVRAIRDFLGVGTVHMKRYPPSTPNACPQLALNVVGKDCLRLVELFDVHPLRSKKRFEYPIWRAAVFLYASMQGGRWGMQRGVADARSKKLGPMRKQIIAIRKYEGPR